MPDNVLKIFQASGDAGTTAKTDTPHEIKVADLRDDDLAEWLRSREYLKQQISNYVHIIAMDNAGDLTAAIQNTPAGTFEGGCKVGGRTRFVVAKTGGRFWSCQPCGWTRDARTGREGRRGVARDREEIGPACPLCGKLTRKRQGRFGAFWGCTGYPHCNGTVNPDD